MITVASRSLVVALVDQDMVVATAQVPVTDMGLEVAGDTHAMTAAERVAALEVMAALTIRAMHPSLVWFPQGRRAFRPMALTAVVAWATTSSSTISRSGAPILAPGDGPTEGEEEEVDAAAAPEGAEEAGAGTTVSRTNGSTGSSSHPLRGMAVALASSGPRTMGTPSRRWDLPPRPQGRRPTPVEAERTALATGTTSDPSPRPRRRALRQRPLCYPASSGSSSTYTSIIRGSSTPCPPIHTGAEEAAVSSLRLPPLLRPRRLRRPRCPSAP
mmetsp:Transcript_29292/g.86764  ORF Transcript_29292/g.86764 Transcript_29292/m.86764 type:complete len:272 (+) Transcript_29292:1183-1998(+)